MNRKLGSWVQFMNKYTLNKKKNIIKYNFTKT